MLCRIFVLHYYSVGSFPALKNVWDSTHDQTQHKSSGENKIRLPRKYIDAWTCTLVYLEDVLANKRCAGCVCAWRFCHLSCACSCLVPASSLCRCAHIQLRCFVMFFLTCLSLTLGAHHHLVCCCAYVACGCAPGFVLNICFLLPVHTHTHTYSTDSMFDICQRDSFVQSFFLLFQVTFHACILCSWQFYRYSSWASPAHHFKLPCW